MTESVADRDLYDPYVCLLARALVIRQEQTDIAEEGVDYSVIKYNPLGSAEFVNANFDVANLEDGSRSTTIRPSCWKSPQCGTATNALPDRVVNAYWSVILVEVPGFRVVPNRLDRFSLNSYSPLESEPDGSLRILISAELDGSVPESNWLPSPETGPFSLTLRSYVPKEVVLRGDWFPPAFERR